jgi:hypothetical protein
LIERYEGAAIGLLTALRLDAVDVPPLLAVVRAMEWEVAHDVPPGTEGWCDYEESTIHVPPIIEAGWDPWAALRHELGHAAGMHGRVSHGEQGADLIGCGIAAPYLWVPRVANRARLDPAAILRAYPQAHPLDVLVRVAVYLPAVLVVRVAGGRVLEVAPRREYLRPLPSEEDLAMAAREAQESVVDERWGLRASPLNTPFGAAVAILGPYDLAG